MNVTLFAVSYTLLSTVLLILADRKRITTQQYNAISAVASTVMGVVAAFIGWTVVAYLAAASAALAAWLWWNGGGGDDTKRRLKSWAGRFHGVRRTAPQGT
ncbi:hypothetical protein [Streptomyces osmaniensis]|uniref:Uncharacterized protein n=1 Tax=Streptomyces osmaniensis TaxID=593134 RepID=A0ABP6YVA4_9ACTN|nr:hypothetical protein KJK32_46685 [Streptomyces sp. JCM17656]